MDVVSRLLLTSPLRVDLIHAFDHRPAVSLPSWITSRRLNVPIIFDWADSWGFHGIAASRPFLERITLGWADDWAERAWRTRSDGLTVINQWLHDRARSFVGEAVPILDLPPGASMLDLNLLPKEQARRQLGYAASDRIVAHAGYAPYDEPLLVDTLCGLAEQGDPINLLTTGRDPAGLADRLDAVGRRDRWVHLGTVDYPRLGVVLSAADVLLLPFSDCGVNWGRTPNKLGDYLAAGRPIVTNPTGDVGRLVEAEGVGLVVEPSADAMIRGVMNLLEHPALLGEMGDRSRKLAAGKMSWSSIAARVEAFYQRTTG